MSIRVFRRAAIVAAAVPVLAAAQPASPAFSRPVLGYIFDTSNKSVRVIAGVPGASSLDAGFAWNGGDLTIAPRGQFGLSTAGGSLTVVNWSSGQPVSSLLQPAVEGEDGAQRVAFSPAGRAAIALYRGKIRTWSGLPASGTLVAEIAAELPEGVTALAVADDASSGALLANGKLYRIAAEGGLMPVDADATFTALAMRPGSSDVATADGAGNRVLLYSGFSAATLAEDIADPEALAFSADGATLVVASHGAGSLVAIDMAARTPVRLDCDCRPDGLLPVSGNAVFRLGSGMKGNLTLLDLDSGAPRLVLVAGGAQ